MKCSVTVSFSFVAEHFSRPFTKQRHGTYVEIQSHSTCTKIHTRGVIVVKDRDVGGHVGGDGGGGGGGHNAVHANNVRFVAGEFGLCRRAVSRLARVTSTLLCTVYNQTAR